MILKDQYYSVILSDNWVITVLNSRMKIKQKLDIFSGYSHCVSYDEIPVI